MKVKTLYVVGLIFWGIMWLGFSFIPARVAAEETNAGKNQSDQLLNRIDFGNSYIMGQSIKSGAVYLMHRKKSEIKSMLQSRQNYREEILENLQIISSESFERTVTEQNNSK